MTTNGFSKMLAGAVLCFAGASSADPTLNENDGLRTDPTFRTKIVEDIATSPQIADVFTVYGWERERFTTVPGREPECNSIRRGRYGFTRVGADVLVRFVVDEIALIPDRTWRPGGESQNWYFTGDQFTGYIAGVNYHTYFPGGEVPDSLIPVSVIEDSWVSFRGPELLGLLDRTAITAARQSRPGSSVHMDGDAVVIESEFETPMEDGEEHPFYTRERIEFIPGTRLISSHNTWVVFRGVDQTESQYLWQSMTVTRWQDEYPREIAFESHVPLELASQGLIVPGVTTEEEARHQSLSERTQYRLHELRHPTASDRISVSEAAQSIHYLHPDPEADPLEVREPSGDGGIIARYEWNESGKLWLPVE